MKILVILLTLFIANSLCNSIKYMNLKKTNIFVSVSQHNSDLTKSAIYGYNLMTGEKFSYSYFDGFYTESKYHLSMRQDDPNSLYWFGSYNNANNIDSAGIRYNTKDGSFSAQVKQKESCDLMNVVWNEDSKELWGISNLEATNTDSYFLNYTISKISKDFQTEEIASLNYYAYGEEPTQWGCKQSTPIWSALDYKTKEMITLIGTGSVVFASFEKEPKITYQSSLSTITAGLFYTGDNKAYGINIGFQKYEYLYYWTEVNLKTGAFQNFFSLTQWLGTDYFKESMTLLRGHYIQDTESSAWRYVLLTKYGQGQNCAQDVCQFMLWIFGPDPTTLQITLLKKIANVGIANYGDIYPVENL